MAQQEGNRIKNQSQESKCEAWNWGRLWIPTRLLVQTAVWCLLSLRRDIECGICCLLPVTIDQWPEMPPSSWAASSLYAFIFSTGFSGRIRSPPCPSSFVLPTEFAVLCQRGREIVYQRFTFWLTRLPGLSRTRAIFLLGLLGCSLSHLCSFASSLSDCLRMERLWFCWLCCFGSAVKQLLIIGAKE